MSFEQKFEHQGEGDIEQKEQISKDKAIKGFASLAYGAAWLALRTGPFPIFELKKDEEEGIEKQGVIKTMLEKAGDAYKVMQKAEELEESDWGSFFDNLFEDKKEQTES